MRRLLIAAALLLATVPALAATLTVTEFKGAPPLSVYYPFATAPAVASQAVAIGASSAQSSAFAATTGLVRIHADIACVVEIGGTNPTAGATSMLFAAGETQWFVVSPGAKVAVKTP